MLRLEQLTTALKELAIRLNCAPEELSLELLNQLEVAIGEGNSIYGRKALTKLLQKRSTDRRALLLQVSTLNQRQEEMFRRIEEARVRLSSILVFLRQNHGEALPLPTDEYAGALTARYGGFRLDGTLRDPVTKPVSASEKPAKQLRKPAH